MSTLSSEDAPRISVIISTYNSPAILKRCMSGFMAQDWLDFDVYIADDGSTDETRSLILQLATVSRFDIYHCWHEDKGFRKPAILNQAISVAKGDYLIFSDGDCIPRADFIRAHATRAARGSFLSGGVEYLSEEATKDLSEDAIIDQGAFDPVWLRKKRDKMRLFGKVNRNPVVQYLARHTSLTRPTFNGHNTSAWKSDLLEVNGFDERMGYGGLDRELGERLVNKGIRGRSVRHDAICIHQFHERPYATEQGLLANLAIRSEVRRKKLTWSNFGLK